jgi:hypothetical protein
MTTFLNSFVGAWFNIPVIFHDGPSYYLAATDEDENELPPHLNPPCTNGERKKRSLPRRGEGEKLIKGLNSSFSLDGRR